MYSFARMLSLVRNFIRLSSIAAVDYGRMAAAYLVQYPIVACIGARHTEFRIIYFPLNDHEQVRRLHGKSHKIQWPDLPRNQAGKLRVQTDPHSECLIGVAARESLERCRTPVAVAQR